MVQLLKSFRDTPHVEDLINFRLTQEVPLLSFNKMCFGLIQNDWCLVFSSLITFIFTIGHLIYSAGGKI